MRMGRSEGLEEPIFAVALRRSVGRQEIVVLMNVLLQRRVTFGRLGCETDKNYQSE